MKKVSLLSLIIIFFAATAIAQDITNPGQPSPNYRSSGVSRYVTINELQFGFSLGDVSVPCSGSLLSFTTIHSYVINNPFTIGGGKGISLYDEGTLVPLFIDVR